MQKRKTIWKLIDQVTEIINQPQAESGLSKQLLGNFQTENLCLHKYSRLKQTMHLLVKNVYCNDGINKVC